MITLTVKYTKPLHIFFHYTRTLENDPLGGCTLNCLCDHPNLPCFFTFAILLSLRLVRFLMFSITCNSLHAAFGEVRSTSILIRALH